MLQKSGRLVLWEAMFILELHSAETQASSAYEHIQTQKSYLHHFVSEYVSGTERQTMEQS